ncbi:MAG: polyhydroxyalkanoate depolymerase [Geminicoccaceae bacterium]|nr:polyhydroxyalkanoate depolymerase [Geminicoccaceae bacterium]
MLYDLIDLQRRQWQAWADMVLTSTAAAVALAPASVLPAVWFARVVGALDNGEVGLEDAVRRDAGQPLGIDTLPSPSPFVRLVRFSSGAGGRPILFVAPFSGYAAAVSSRLVAALAAIGEVVVTDWRDARDIPPEAGPFGLDRQIGLIADLARAMGQGVDLVGLSQSGPAVVAAAALGLRRGDPPPARLVLLGAPIDMRETPAALCAALPADCLVSRVPRHYAGAGREVYPGLFQLMAYSFANPAVYLTAQSGLWHEMAAGETGLHSRMHGELHGLIDVPAELYRDMLELVLRRSALAEGTLVVDGGAIDARLLAHVPMLTVEARGDELVGRGRTHAAHRLTGRLEVAAPHLRAFVDGGHYELFGGPGFDRTLTPLLRHFLGDRRDGGRPR